ncbi:MAG: HIRAN domain-containing protein [Gemmatimonadota bacterium]
MPHTTRENAPLPPPLPPKESRLRTNVHGSVFAARTSVVDRLQVGDRLLLVPDPPQEDDPPAVWVHVSGGDVLGHVPVQIAAWLGPWMLAGGRCQARVVAVGGPDVASWNRIEIELHRSVPGSA